jgi:uncharacterized protein YjbJ (UPF0337 family)
MDQEGSDELGSDRRQVEAISCQVKEKWGQLTDDELDVIAGKRDKLVGKIQEKHGLNKEEAERQLDEWQKYVRI